MHPVRRRLRAFAVLAGLSSGALVGCASTQTPGPATPPATWSLVEVPRVRLASVTAPHDVPIPPPSDGTHRVHLIDVGTGLAILVQGPDFSLLYDGGSMDDGHRLLAYLAHAVGPSGPADCAPEGDGWLAVDRAPVRLEHVVLSHPHADHGSALADVLRCYEVDHVWDAGVPAQQAFYRDFLRAVFAEPGVTYHTAGPRPTDHRVHGETLVVPPTLGWAPVHEGDVQALGADARFTVLHADGEPHANPNDNSLVLRVELGSVSLLLLGDAGSGSRLDPEHAPAGVEARLLAHHRDALDVDIVQVGHHGSLTGSRAAFLGATSPSWALLGAGPHPYHGVVLPDAPVVDALTRALGDPTHLLRTDARDGSGCPVADRVGADDARPGGCDNWVLEIAR